MTDPAPAIDLFFALLHAAGWSIGGVFATDGWLVTGTNGDASLVAGATTQSADSEARVSLLHSPLEDLST